MVCGVALGVTGRQGTTNMVNHTVIESVVRSEERNFQPPQICPAST